MVEITRLYQHEKHQIIHADVSAWAQGSVRILSLDLQWVNYLYMNCYIVWQCREIQVGGWNKEVKEEEKRTNIRLFISAHSAAV